jgi:predicted amidophosphoribosyltransferase
VALMDDVVTTASTVAECARILRASGATDIEIWAIARAATLP